MISAILKHRRHPDVNYVCVYSCVDICDANMLISAVICTDEWNDVMAGSIKWFVYTDDLGESWALKLDESNTEAVNGSTNDLISGANVPNALPRNVKPRAVFYTNADRTRRIRCVCLTPTIYSGVVNGGVPSIPDPIAGGSATLGLIAAKGEERILPVPLDTGLNDGDAS